MRQSPRELLVATWPGRLFLISAALKLLVVLWRLTGLLPVVSRVVSGAATLGLVVSVAAFTWRLFFLMKGQLLWRVRRKLILSYIFIGAIPSLLILAFFLLAGELLSMFVSAYLFKDGYQKVLDDAKVTAQAAAIEITRDPDSAAETMARVHRIRLKDYPGIAAAFIAADGKPEAIGRWRNLPLPRALPPWAIGDAFTITIGQRAPDAPAEENLTVRALAKVPVDAGGGFVIVDIPVDDRVVQRLQESTGVRIESVIRAVPGTNPAAERPSNDRGTQAVLFRNAPAQIEVRDWRTGERHNDTVWLGYRMRDLYDQLSTAQAFIVSGMRLADALMWLIVLVGVLFLIIEAVAVVMGFALARSITRSVHELFMGTERVRQGDFTHRIPIRSRDQLGDLADSFNQMTGSIENLLQTAAEKKRLEEELRIARQIQMSLLPRGPLAFRGIGVTALCVPAREVGGDYYDFFRLGENRLGVLIADVSGKGTSAAFYMAELKGLVLSLSQIYQSPRQLLLEVNRIISENLDTRSFITMTYAVIDLNVGTLTFARAGHTPLLYLPGERDSAVQLLTPNGLVVGLRIPGAMEKFSELLEECSVNLQRGDVFVFYTDGISEAMNHDSDLFGDARLGRIVAEHGHLDAGELRERILREIESFVGGADQHDDMTMILIKVEEAVVTAQQVAV